jgi:hypothetical protein
VLTCVRMQIQSVVGNVSQVVCSIYSQNCVLLTLSCWKSESRATVRRSHGVNYMSVGAMCMSRE